MSLKGTYFSGLRRMREPQGQISGCNWTRVVCGRESKLGGAGSASTADAALPLGVD